IGSFRPEDKLLMVQCLQDKGHVVAFVGRRLSHTSVLKLNGSDTLSNSPNCSMAQIVHASKLNDDGDLATDDCDEKENFLKRSEGIVVGTAIVTKLGASLLDSIYQADQALHGHHLEDDDAVQLSNK
ncbi:putative calcium-transporting ATPase 12, plasma membrane-type-like, partial [Sesbania bispinosa]